MGRGFIARRGLVFAAVLLLLIAVAAACGGSGDDDDDGVEVVMSTFTPIPPDFTPEAIQTRSANETAFAQTSTAQPNVTPTAPSGSPPSGTPAVGTPRATAQEGELRPPDAILRATGGDTFGAVGSFNFLDPVTEVGANIEAQYVPLPGDAVSWRAGEAARIDVPNSPYPVRSATIEIYTYDDNVVLPQSAAGVPTGEVAFFAQTDPSQQTQLSGPSLSVTADIPPGDYVVSARIVWDAPPVVIDDTGPQEQHTEYVYVIKVE